MVADHLKPSYLGIGELEVGTGMLGHNPVLEIFANGVVESSEFGIDAAGAANERDEGSEFADRLFALVIFEMAIGLPDAQWGHSRGIGPEFGHDLVEHGKGNFATAERFVEQDGQRG